MWSPDPSIIIFGNPGAGLDGIQGCRMGWADKIVGVDINPDEKGHVRREVVLILTYSSRTKMKEDLVPYLVDLTEGGADLLLRVHRQRGR